MAAGTGQQDLPRPARPARHPPALPPCPSSRVRAPRTDTACGPALPVPGRCGRRESRPHRAHRLARLRNRPSWPGHCRRRAVRLQPRPADARSLRSCLCLPAQVLAAPAPVQPRATAACRLAWSCLAAFTGVPRGAAGGGGSGTASARRVADQGLPGLSPCPRGRAAGQSRRTCRARESQGGQQPAAAPAFPRKTLKKLTML